MSYLLYFRADPLHESVSKEKPILECELAHIRTTGRRKIKSLVLLFECTHVVVLLPRLKGRGVVFSPFVC